MSIDWINFTPWSATIGGAVIGLAAALFVLIKNMTPDKVLREIQDAGGTVLTYRGLAEEVDAVRARLADAPTPGMAGGGTANACALRKSSSVAFG